MPMKTGIVDWGLLTQAQAVSDAREADKGNEHDIQLFETREDAAIALQQLRNWRRNKPTAREPAPAHDFGP
jgi:acyl-CoA synthetase (NDP forming)